MSSVFRKYLFIFNISFLTSFSITDIFLYMGMAQKIRLLLVKKDNISEAELARRLGTAPSNLHNKMKRDNFSENELREIGDILGCDLKMCFVDRKTGEET